MDKIAFIKKIGLWVGAIAALIFLIVGLGWGKVIEETLFGEVTKWIVMGIGVIAIIEGLTLGIIAPLAWHFKQKKGK